MALNADEKKIVIARLRNMPASIRVSVGSFGSFDKRELLEHVESEDEVGTLISKVYMNGLRAFKTEVEEHAR